MFNFIKNKLQKIFSTVTSKLGSLFGRTTIDEKTLKELEIILISSDVGVKTTRSIIEKLKKNSSSLSNGTQLKTALHNNLLKILECKQKSNITESNVLLLVGINGSGKTTTIGKLAHMYTQQGKKILLVAADTFRAAATEQLLEWAHRSNTDIVCGKDGQDPASVVYQGCEQFKTNNYDMLIIDTAGRLHTKINLMNELAKIKRIISKQLPNEHVSTLLTIDAMLGQNSFEQAKLFKDSTDLDGIILTKMDGTGKGGIVFAIVQELAVPIIFITFGESADHIKLFDSHNYVTELLG